MSRRHTMYNHPKHGPVRYELVSCDECSDELQPEHMAGWFLLRPQGISIGTMSKPEIDDLDFCSLRCLYVAAASMNGVDV